MKFRELNIFTSQSPSMYPFNSWSAQRLCTKILNPPASWSYHSVFEVMKMMMLVFVFSRLRESCFTLTQNAVRLFFKKSVSIKTLSNVKKQKRQKID